MVYFSNKLNLIVIDGDYVISKKLFVELSNVNFTIKTSNE